MRRSQPTRARPRLADPARLQSKIQAHMFQNRGIDHARLLAELSGVKTRCVDEAARSIRMPLLLQPVRSFAKVPIDAISNPIDVQGPHPKLRLTSRFRGSGQRDCLPSLDEPRYRTVVVMADGGAKGNQRDCNHSERLLSSEHGEVERCGEPRAGDRQTDGQAHERQADGSPPPAVATRQRDRGKRHREMHGRCGRGVMRGDPYGTESEYEKCRQGRIGSTGAVVPPLVSVSSRP